MTIGSGRSRVGPASQIGRDLTDVTLHVSNFKAVGSAALAPVRLTVIAGSNSSGKSSLVQAALFFAQSYGQPQIVINGDLVRLGEPSDVLRDGANEVVLEFLYDVTLPNESGQKNRSVTFGLRVQLAPNEEQLAPTRMSFWRDGAVVLDAVEPSGLVSLPLTEEELPLRILNADTLSLPAESYLIVEGLTPQRVLFRASNEGLARTFDEVLQQPARLASFALDELMVRPARYPDRDEPSAESIVWLNKIRRQMLEHSSSPLKLSKKDRARLFEIFVESHAPGGWSTEPVGARYTRSRTMSRAALSDDGPSAYLRTLARVGAARDRMGALANAMRYLGPLREDPRVAYPLGHTVRNLPVGEKGEFTAAYLERNRRTNVAYVAPESSGPPSRGLLWTAVSQWCRYLGIADKISVTPQGKLGHQLGLEVGGHQRDPTAIGVGASQLLPVVVMVLGAPENAVVFLEQPELHLHPKVQSRLGDFFAFARPDIRLVVETHSEYLLTRLRLRAAEGRLDASDLAVLFASQKPVERVGTETQSAATRFTRLGVDELGDFNLWPDDFFDTLTQDSVALAQAISRRLDERKEGR